MKHLRKFVALVPKSVEDESMATRMSAFVDVFRKEMNGSDTDIICIDGKVMRSTVYENGRTSSSSLKLIKDPWRYG